MHLIQAILMGIVQGLSEFLPISSSGHLVLTSNFYKIFKNIEITHSSQEIFFDIMLHLGTLIAVLIYFRKDLLAILEDLIKSIKTRNFDSKNSKIGIYILIGTFFSILIAYPLTNIAQHLVFKPAFVGLILIMTGVILLLSEFLAKKRNEKQDITLKSAILIGIAQGIAALPGFSRSGLTIATGLLTGSDRTTSAKYSFLLSIPIIAGASLFYPLLEINFKDFSTFNWTIILIGTLVSGIVGYLCIKFFMKFLAKFSLTVFGYYCILVGTFAFIFFNII